MTKIAIVVPTNRPESIQNFLRSWIPIATRHGAVFYIVKDGDTPFVSMFSSGGGALGNRVPDKAFKGLIFTHTDSVRNAGFVEALKDGAEVIISLDDDVFPLERQGDPIEGHLLALSQKLPISWFNPCDNFMRGFPYWARTEAEVVVSSGVWFGDPDYDAVTRIATGGKDLDESFPYRGAIPRGCLTPVCGMNLAFKRSVAPKVYFAPMGPRTPYNRFGDIWMGMRLKSWLDEQRLAMAHGYSSVLHRRQSCPFKSLAAEAAGIAEHENRSHLGGTGDYDYSQLYLKCLARWEKLVTAMI
jgi:hypothetical protein